MTTPSTLDEALKQLDEAVAEATDHPDPTAGEDLPEYDPLPLEPEDTAVTFVKK